MPPSHTPRDTFATPARGAEENDPRVDVTRRLLPPLHTSQRLRPPCRVRGEMRRVRVAGSVVDGRVLLLLLALLAAAEVSAGDTHVEKLVVLHRHGSRTRLLKAHADLAEGGASLTPLGQRQLYQVSTCVG